VFGFGVEDALVIFDPMKVEETRFGQFENKLDAVPLNNECKFVMYIELPMDPDTKVEIQRDAMSMEKGEDAQKRWIFLALIIPCSLACATIPSCALLQPSLSPVVCIAPFVCNMNIEDTRDVLHTPSLKPKCIKTVSFPYSATHSGWYLSSMCDCVVT